DLNRVRSRDGLALHGLPLQHALGVTDLEAGERDLELANQIHQIVSIDVIDVVAGEQARFIAGAAERHRGAVHVVYGVERAGREDRHFHLAAGKLDAIPEVVGIDVDAHGNRGGDGVNHDLADGEFVQGEAEDDGLEVGEGDGVRGGFGQRSGGEVYLVVEGN